MEVIFSEKKDLGSFDSKYKVCKSLFEEKNQENGDLNQESGHLTADQVLLKYVCQSQGENFLRGFGGFKSVDVKEYMSLSSQSIRHLEIFNTYEGQLEGSLFYTINKTVTPLGSRKLKSWLRKPFDF